MSVLGLEPRTPKLKVSCSVRERVAATALSGLVAASVVEDQAVTSVVAR
ncbi:hypothetical protein MJC1_03567 [Methylocystis sp. MJC1]|nr:hypothetical protein MJC1_03567 [Methylocystis sp. MJC1]